MEQAKIPPGLPCQAPSVSYWQKEPSDLADLQTTPQLPATADYIIVGSGISGAWSAYTLLKKRPKTSVILLEARQAGSGATGRNGGHTKAASYRAFLDHEKKYGTPEAVKIARLEYANVQRTHEFAREHGIDCASTACDTIDIIKSRYHWEQGRKAIERIVTTMGSGDPAARYHIWSAEEAAQNFLSPNALGAFSYPAGSLSAYQFTIGVLKLALDKGLNFQANTPVDSIGQVERSKQRRWHARTPRGTVEAPHLILATNGYTAHLLPEFQGLIVPLHGQVVAQRPGSGLPQNGLPMTYSYIKDDGYEYMITRPPGSKGSGDIIIGGGIHVLPNGGASRFGNTDDTSLDPSITEYLRDCTVGYFGSNWGNDHPQGRIKREWSGIMGATADGLPYVGAVPDKAGLWVCAGFNGHGMVWCLKSAEALVEMMTGDRAAQIVLDRWFPRPARLSQERMKVQFTGGDWQVPAEPEFQESKGRL